MIAFAYGGKGSYIKCYQFLILVWVPRYWLYYSYRFCILKLSRKHMTYKRGKCKRHFKEKRK